MEIPKEYKTAGKIVLFKDGPLSQSYNEGSSFVPDPTFFGHEGNPTFSSAEQWLMCAKAIIMDDVSSMQKILDEDLTEKQHELGRNIKNFKSSLWNKHKQKAAYYGNLWKFEQNEELKNFLLSFKHNTIFKYASVDPIWGIGIDLDDRAVLNESKHTGKNLLGKIIQKIHRRLIKQRRRRKTVTD